MATASSWGNGERRAGFTDHFPRIVRRAASLGVLLAASLAPIGGTARAQLATGALLDEFSSPDIAGVGVESGVTVRSRVRSDYDRLGVRLGNIVVRPDLTVRTGYDDNVLGTRTPRGSAVVETSASLLAASDWSKDSLAVRFAVDDNRYPDQPSQSYTNWSASLAGSYDFGRDSLSAYYQHRTLNQTPRDLDTPLLDRTIEYRVDSVRVGYRTPFNRLAVQPEVAVSLYSFDDGSVGGVPYRQRFRDRTVVTPGITVTYELAPRRNLVVVGRDATASYRRPQPGAQLRDYNDASVLAGFDYDGGGLWRYRVLAGYQVRTFSAANLKTIQAPVAEATVIFSPTGLTTLTGTVSRRVADSANEATVGVTETAFRLTVDHEYARNVLFQARGAVYWDEYGRGPGQSLYAAGIGATWLLDRNLRLSASYDFVARQSRGGAVLGAATAGGASQGLGGSYTENRYLLQLSIGL